MKVLFSTSGRRPLPGSGDHIPAVFHLEVSMAAWRARRPVAAETSGVTGWPLDSSLIVIGVANGRSCYGRCGVRDVTLERTLSEVERRQAVGDDDLGAGARASGTEYGAGS